MRLLRATTLLFALASLARGAERLYGPLELARRLEARLASGEGALLPDAERPLVRHAGTVDLTRGDWPEAFSERAGESVCVAVSPFTGCYEFFDETGEVFWTVIPVTATTENWVAPFRHAEDDAHSDDGLYAPWRLVDVWLLSHTESAEFLSHVAPTKFDLVPRSRDNDGPLRWADNSEVSNLCFTAFSLGVTNLFFTAAWPTNEPPPDATLDLYGATNLSSRCWTLLSSHPATNSPASFAVPRSSLPWPDTALPHVHDETCVSLTNFVVSPLDGTTIYTNVFWSCSINRSSGETSFFRLGTRLDTDGDGLTDAREILVLGTDPSDPDSDGDGVPDGATPAVWRNHPLWAADPASANLIIDLVAIAPTNKAVLCLGDLVIPLSTNSGPFLFALPPGQLVPCRLTAHDFVLLWYGTPNPVDPPASLWMPPEDPGIPLWCSAPSAVFGPRVSGGFCEFAVPVLSVVPIGDDEPHFSTDGSVCVHGDGVSQAFAWTMEPAVCGMGLTATTEGSAVLQGGVPVIDVSGPAGLQTGALRLSSPETDYWATPSLWGSVKAFFSAHRSNATADAPHCSSCGCYDPLDAALFVSQNLLTLRHDDLAYLRIEHPNSPGETYSDPIVEIRRVGDAQWLTLGPERNLAPWKARIAGRFELRGRAQAGGRTVTTGVEAIEVRFPGYDDIVGDSVVEAAMDATWQMTKDNCTATPNRRRELGFWIQLDTFNDTYEIGTLIKGSWVTPADPIGQLPVSPYRPPDLPTLPDANGDGGMYTVALFHTHTPRTYLDPTQNGRKVGPSRTDWENNQNRHLVSIVYDYVGSPDPENNPTNNLYNGHSKDAPARLYPVDSQRRPTP